MGNREARRAVRNGWGRAGSSGVVEMDGGKWMNSPLIDDSDCPPADGLDARDGERGISANSSLFWLLCKVTRPDVALTAPESRCCRCLAAREGAIY